MPPGADPLHVDLDGEAGSLDEVQGSAARKDAYEEGERWMPMMHVLMSSVGVLGRVRDGGARIDEKEVDAVTSPRW